MAKDINITYERLSPRDVKVIYTSGTKRTEIVALVVAPGSYTKCDDSCAMDKPKFVPDEKSLERESA